MYTPQFSEVLALGILDYVDETMQMRAQQGISSALGSELEKDLHQFRARNYTDRMEIQKDYHASKVTVEDGSDIEQNL